MGTRGAGACAARRLGWIVGDLRRGCKEIVRIKIRIKIKIRMLDKAGGGIALRGRRERDTMGSV